MQQNVHLKYRPDVDGLRAVAVLAVLVFHLFPKLLPGGFVGVDVFFIISGYLISGIILWSLKQGSFSFADFYIKRVNRIFPALLLVLLSVFTAGWFYLLQDEFQKLGKHIHKATVFFSNVAFFNEARYFDGVGDLKPLLHLWSLGIEEQFYLIWPLLLFLFWKKSRKVLLFILACLGVSFILNLWEVNRNISAAFYLPQYRFWELLIGATLAARETFVTKRFGVHPNLKAGVGLALILGSIFTFDGNMLFPGYWALLPTLGAVFMISAGMESAINRLLLAHPAMVWVGLISYPLYLWHWPLISFARIVQGAEPTTNTKYILGALAFALAWATYNFIEKPLKTTDKNRRLKIAYAFSAAMVVVSLLGVATRREKIMARNNKGEFNLIMSGIEDWMFPGPGAVEQAPAPGVRAFTLGTNPRKVLFLGDSNVEQYYPRVDHVVREHPEARSALFLTESGCLPILEARDIYFPKCPAVIEAAQTVVNDPSIETVVIGAQWMFYFQYGSHTEIKVGNRLLSMNYGSEGYMVAVDSLAKMLQRFVAAGKRVYFVLNIPVGDDFNPRKMIHRNFPSGEFTVQQRPFDRVEFDKRWLPIKQHLTAMAKHSGAIVLDPMEVLCDATTCPTMGADGRPFYKDESHLRPYYSVEKATFLDAAFF